MILLKNISYATFIAFLSFAATAQDSAEYSLKVMAKKGINHADGSNAFSTYAEYLTRTMAQLQGFKPRETGLSKYGGRTDKRDKATGFFHTKKINGRWWVIDPEGYYYLHNAMNDISMGSSDRNKKALQDQFGNKKGWIDQTHHLLIENGFNGAGSWSDVEAIRGSSLQNTKPLAYTINWDFMSNYGATRGGTHQVSGHKAYINDVIYTFDPGFEQFCNERARLLSKYKDDPSVFGYFSDNEIPLARKNLDGYLKLPQTEPGYLAAKKWIDEQGIKADQITDQNRQAFLGYAADRYFKIVSEAIKKYDPNHMYLGCRFYGAQRYYPELIKATAKYLDIVSINYYNNWTPQKDYMRDWEIWSGKPFIVTEWYVKGEDSGLGNTSGAGWVVKTQHDRGLFYQNFALGLIESKNCVGWHWFKYMDNDPTKAGAEPSNTDANKGIVDNYYKPYQPLLDQMKQLNRQMYALADYFDIR